MSRRKLQWKHRAIQAGDINKILPQGAKGTGEWLVKATIAGREMKMPQDGEYEGKPCSVAIGARKEQLVRQWTR